MEDYSKLTKQDLFDRVVAHLRKQGEKAVSMQGSCRYRTASGLQCGIGGIIPDDMYDYTFENKPIGALMEYALKGFTGINLHFPNFNEDFWKWLALDRQFTTELQRLHDCKAVYEWEDALLRLAGRHQLIYTLPDTDVMISAIPGGIDALDGADSIIEADTPPQSEPST